jgi:hypothetical protein
MSAQSYSSDVLDYPLESGFPDSFKKKFVETLFKFIGG